MTNVARVSLQLTSCLLRAEACVRNVIRTARATHGVLHQLSSELLIYRDMSCYGMLRYGILRCSVVCCLMLRMLP